MDGRDTELCQPTEHPGLSSFSYLYQRKLAADLIIAGEKNSLGAIALWNPPSLVELNGVKALVGK